MKKFRLFILLGMILQSENISAQKQFIANPGFENISINKYSITMNSANPQVFPIEDTSAFWALSDKLHTPVKALNCLGQFFYSVDQKPRSGNTYAMIAPISVDENGLNKFSGAGLLLSDTLEKDKMYEIHFYIKSFAGNCFINELSVGFSNDTFSYYSSDVINFDNSDQYLKLHKQGLKLLVSDTTFKINSTGDYEEVKFTYAATGGEKSIFIGNIYGVVPQKLSKVKRFGYYKKLRLKFYSFYLLDDVSITEIVNKRTNIEFAN